MPRESERQKDKTEEEMWRDREKRLEELLEKEGENPEAKKDFNRLLEETVHAAYPIQMEFSVEK